MTDSTPENGFSQAAPDAFAEPTPEEKNWAMAAHLSWIVGSLVALYFLGPLVVYLVKKDSTPFVRKHAVEALNFALTTLIGFLICLVLMMVLIGVILIIPLAIAYLVFSILGAIEASKGREYRYPFNINFIK